MKVLFIFIMVVALAIVLFIWVYNEGAGAIATVIAIVVMAVALIGTGIHIEKLKSDVNTMTENIEYYQSLMDLEKDEKKRNNYEDRIEALTEELNEYKQENNYEFWEKMSQN